MNTDLKIRYKGQPQEIDANVFINSLIHTTTLIQEINKELNTGNKVEVKIKALEKGSFLVHVQLIETVIESLKNIFTSENIAVGSAIISSLVGVIQLKQFLKSDKHDVVERDQDNTTIRNSNGDVIVIKNINYNIYQNSPIIRESIEQNFEALNNDPSIEGFEITDIDEKPYVTIEREQFSSLTTRNEEVMAGEKIITLMAKLYIIRLSFEDNLNWEFYYHGNRIGAKIKDPKFYELIDKGERFAKGDILEVELAVRQKFDTSVNTYINKSYHINHIVNHIPRDEQQRINFSSSD